MKHQAELHSHDEIRQVTQIAFGPVPSRRLGYSLGINHIPLKHCSYNCVYCQLGRTKRNQVDRQAFYPVDLIVDHVASKIAEIQQQQQPLDYLTLVADGEPTLDAHLGELIVSLQALGYPVAVISNASMLMQEPVQKDLLLADWVSLKLDALDERAWRQINRPAHQLELPMILKGMLAFRQRYCGELVTETMLVSGINDGQSAIVQLCGFLHALQPMKAYLSLPIRPPAEKWVKPPAPEKLEQILSAISERVPFMAFLFGNEPDDFISTGNIVQDVLAILAVHPLRGQALKHLVQHAGADWAIVDDLLHQKQIVCVNYQGEPFYLKAA